MAAPKLDATKTPVFASVTEDADGPVGAVGSTVASLMSVYTSGTGGLSNGASTTALGMAITGLNSSEGTWYYSTNNGNTWTAVSSVSSASALLLSSTARLYFEPDADYAGTQSNALTFRAWNGTGGTNGGRAKINTSNFSSASDTVSVTVKAVNDAPVLHTDALSTFSPVSEDAAAPVGAVGMLVTDLINSDNTVTDVDSANLGIAISGLNTEHGSWFYSTNGGTTWTAMGAVSTSAALLLSADANTRLYFQPTEANYNGSISGAISYHAWDKSTGTSGSTANVTTRGGSTAFSSATESLNLTVNAVNDAPAFVFSTSEVTVAENTSTSTAIGSFSATDVDAGDTITYSLLGDDAALFNIDPSTGVVTFKNAPNFENPQDVGANNHYSVIVRATDGNGATVDSGVMDVVVSDVNEAPTFTAAPATATVAENTLAATTVATFTATDVDLGDSVTYSLSGADAALFDINTTTGVVTFKNAPNFENPQDAGANNVYNVTVTATDSHSATVSSNLEVTVTNVNEAPIVANVIADAPTAEDAAYSFVVPANTFSDVDAGTTLTYSATLANGDPLPAWLHFDAATRTFSGTPANGDVGTITVRVSASDGVAAPATEDFALTVTNVNDAPTVQVEINNQTTAEDAVYSFTVPANTFGDEDVGDTLTYSATLANGDPLPGWLTFNAATQTFSATPTNDQVGTISVRVTANDGEATVSEDFNLTVTNVNDAPTFTTAPAMVNVAENTTAVTTFVAADVDAGDTITYSLSGDDAALFDINATTGVVTFKNAPDAETPLDVGADNTYNVTVTATDAHAGSISSALEINVTDDQAPIVGNTGTTVAFTENGAPVAVNAGVTVENEGADDVAAISTATISITENFVTGQDVLSPSAPLPMGVVFAYNSATGVATIVADPAVPVADMQSYLRLVTYSNSSDNPTTTPREVTIAIGNSEVTTTITVAATNDAPVLLDPALQVSFNENGTGTVATVTGTDVDSANLTYSLTGDDAALFDINATTGAITFKNAPNYENPADTGTDNVYNVNVVVNDGALTDSRAVEITVADVNDMPVITSVSSTVEAFSSVSDIGTNASSLTGKLLAEDDETASANLTYTLTDLPNLGTLYLDGHAMVLGDTFTQAQIDSGKFEYTSTSSVATATDDSFSFTVTDEATLAGSAKTTTEHTHTITVLPVNTKPNVDAMDNKSVAENAGATVLDSSVSITDPNTTNFAGGSINVSIASSALTDVLSISQTGGVTVSGSNVLYNGVVVATINEVANGVGTNLTLNIVEAVPPVSFSVVQELVQHVTYHTTSKALDAGESLARVVTVTVNDGETFAKEESTTMTLTVDGVNDAPVVDHDILDASTAEDAAYSFTFAPDTFSDPDVEALTYTAEIAGGGAWPAWLNFDAATRTFSGTPPNGAVGAITVRVNASDGTTTTSEDFVLTVTNVNDAPTLSGTLAYNYNENATTGISMGGGDEDVGDTLTYTLSGDDAALFDIDASGNITFKNAPNYEAPADLDMDNVYDVVVTVTDAANATATKTITITVDDLNEAPVFATESSTLPYDENATTAVGTYAATDQDGDTITYSLSGEDAALFNINAVTGEVTFKNAPNFENKLDDDEDGVYKVTVVADDGTVSTNHAVTITVADKNDAAVLAAASATSVYVDTATAQVVNAGITVADQDVGELFSGNVATVDIGAGYDLGHDTLALVANAGTMGDIATSYNAATGTLTLSSAGGVTAAQLQAALQAVTFVTDTYDTGTPSRTITFDVTDGGVNSNTLTTTVSVLGQENEVTVDLRTDSASVQLGVLDVLAIDGVSASDVTFTNGATPTISYTDVANDMDTDTITLTGETGGFDGSMIQFANGSVLKVGSGVAGTLTGTSVANGDQLVAGSAGDRLVGLAGNDKLVGGAGADTFFGGSGNDAIVTSADTEVDTFLYSARTGSQNDGADTITGFEDGVDLIKLTDVTTALLGSNFADYVSSITAADGGANTLITLHDGNTIKLVGVDSTDVTSADFVGYM